MNVEAQTNANTLTTTTPISGNAFGRLPATTQRCGTPALHPQSTVKLFALRAPPPQESAYGLTKHAGDNGGAKR